MKLETREKLAKEIEAITDEELLEMPIWRVLEEAMPYGVVADVAESLDMSESTLHSWRANPQIVDESIKHGDPRGRRGEPHHFYDFLNALNGVFSAGAQLVHRWEGLKLAKGQATKGDESMLLVMQLADEAKAIAEQHRLAEAQARTFFDKLTAIIGGSLKEKT